MQTNNVQILVLDFGSQYTQLIARRLRECGVYTEIVPYFEKLDSIKSKNPKGIILSGGPASVYEKDAFKPDSAIFDLNIPILGICYGMQYIAHFFGGKVVKAPKQEFGKAVLEIGTHKNVLFENIKQDSIVWMSHADKVESLPSGFVELARSGNTHYCAIANLKKSIYALQFHPEVVHSECGAEILKNFAVGICASKTTWNMQNFAKDMISNLRQKVLGNAMIESENAGGKRELKRCEWARAKNADDERLYQSYHDNEWGVPLHDDRRLFEFLILEGFQAGLSWLTILKKREAFRVAFDNFDYHKIAAYDEKKIESLMHDEGIIRNRVKIKATITNAQAFIATQKEFGSFDSYIWGFVGHKSIINHFKSIDELPAKSALAEAISKDLQNRGFRFVGERIVYAFMQAIGMVNDHLESCFKHNSSLGMQCDKILDFPQGTDTKSANLAKNPKSLHSHTTNTRIVASNLIEVRTDSGSAVSLRDFRSCEAATRGSCLEGNDRSGVANSLKITKETTSKVLCAVSGGVDSSVVATLLYRAIGENLIPVFVDTGLLRKGERVAVEAMFKENLKVPLIVVDASELFLGRLKGVIDPEKKRKIIGETFIEVFEKEAKKHNTHGEIKFLAQGTLYPDVIESVSVNGPSKTIKSHHNVGGLPEWMKFELIEPLRELFKDEVRELGRELGMPESMLMRHPFPGPGLGIRILGEVNKADLDLLRDADSIFIEELQRNGLYDKVWQAFCVLLNIRSVGVMGDNRTYDNTIALRAVEAIDGMSATFAHLKHDFLESVANRIINEVKGINRVVYDITSKPPGTIEWE